MRDGDATRLYQVVGALQRFGWQHKLSSRDAGTPICKRDRDQEAQEMPGGYIGAARPHKEMGNERAGVHQLLDGDVDIEIHIRDEIIVRLWFPERRQALSLGLLLLARLRCARPRARAARTVVTEQRVRLALHLGFLLRLARLLFGALSGRFLLLLELLLALLLELNFSHALRLVDAVDTVEFCGLDGGGFRLGRYAWRRVDRIAVQQVLVLLLLDDAGIDLGLGPVVVVQAFEIVVFPLEEGLGGDFRVGICERSFVDVEVSLVEALV
jgi:hypothetical protein